MSRPWCTAGLVVAGLLALAAIPTVAADALLHGQAAWLGPAGFVLLGAGLLLAAVPRSPAWVRRRGWSR